MSNYVFLSHKERDRDLALALKELLQGATKVVRNEPQLEVFASSDATGIKRGKLWFQQIHEELGRATALIMLYTDQRQIWDWCLYEAGYFAGGFPSVDKVNNLFVFHPKQVPRPAPLQHWQSVPADPTEIDGVLEQLFRSPRGGCYFDYRKATRMDVAKKIAAAIASYDPIPVLSPHEIYLTIEGEAREKADTPDTLEFNVRVKISEPLRIKLGLPRTDFLLKDFIEHKEVKDARIDGDVLARLIAELLTNRTIQTTFLPACLLNGQGYRPSISDVSLIEGHKGSMQIVFQAIPSNLKPEAADALQVLGDLISLAIKFRISVVDKYAQTLDPETIDPSERAPTPPPDVQPVAQAKPLLYDIDTHISEALAAGMNSEFRILRAFPDNLRRQAEEVTRKWRGAYAQLAGYAKVPALSADDLRNVFRNLRSANFDYLMVAVEALRAILATVEPPNDAPFLPPPPPPSLPSPERSWWRRILGI